MPRIRVFLAVALGGVIALHACKVYDESLLDGSGGKPVSKDLWGSGVGFWSRVRNDGCVSAGVPTKDMRPKSAPAGDVGEVFFAVRSMALGSLDRNGEKIEGAWKDLGFDLDGLCTNSDTCDHTDEQFSCNPKAAMSADGNYCRDNTFGLLEQQTVSVNDLGKTFGLSNDTFNCALCRGDYNFVFRLTGWNGQDNDDNVRVDIYPSPGLETQTATWQCDLNDTSGAWKANGCWTQADKFTIQTGTYEGSITGKPLPNALLNDPTAYVRDGYVVAELPENTLFWFPGKSAAWAYPLKLQKGLVVGKLTKVGEVYHLEDGTIAGRARNTDLIQGFKDLGLCEENSLWPVLTTQLGLNSDVLWNGTNAEEVNCDAVSVGIGFEAEQADYSLTPRDGVGLPGCPVVTDGGTEGGTDAASDAASDAGTD
jgi:hypothetical protein